jgi:hypothetical protein
MPEVTAYVTEDTSRRIARLPRDKHGRPVPWFVAWIDGVPDFRVIGENKLIDAIRFRWCWVCGQPLGANVAYVIGPMCAINRVSAEPPSHADCAFYSAKMCPFLTTPRMRRRDSRMPEDMVDPAGNMIERNPGVALVWATRKVKPFRVDNGLLFNVGDPEWVAWFAEGRAATRAEVLASIESGLPLLEAEADKDPDPEDARAELARQHEAALRLVPA